MESRQYIKCTARGDRWRVAKIAAARGVPFALVKEIRDGDLVETVGRVELEYKREVAAWFRDSIGRPDVALLAYAVTTDARELIREIEQEERVEAAKRTVAERAQSRPSRRKAAKRKAPPPDAGSHAANRAAAIVRECGCYRVGPCALACRKPVIICSLIRPAGQHPQPRHLPPSPEA